MEPEGWNPKLNQSQPADSDLQSMFCTPLHSGSAVVVYPTVTLGCSGHHRKARPRLGSGSGTGDALLFHYSGHGGRMPRDDGKSEPGPR